MASIPEDAKWYLAEIVEEFQIMGEQANLVHINFVLVRADSSEEAYNKAIELGKEGESSYENKDGKLVTCVFRGLHNLHVIQEELEHGAELLYERQVGLTEEQVGALVRPKNQLNVFRPFSPMTGPSIASKEILKELEAFLEIPFLTMYQDAGEGSV
jgi:hypothetical protein